MRDVPYPTEYERMRGNIRVQLAAESAMGDLQLDDVTLDRMAEGIAGNLDYGFTVTWAPRWIKDGAPHRWSEGDEHFVECAVCRRITAHLNTLEADRWWSDHLQAEHS